MNRFFAIVGSLGSDLRVLGGWNHGEGDVYSSEQGAERRREETLSRNRSFERNFRLESEDRDNPAHQGGACPIGQSFVHMFHSNI